MAVAAVAAVVAGCAGSDPGLVVGAASSLEPSLRELAERFEDETGARVTVVYAASGTVARQIEEGAPIDVFASADPVYTDSLARGGFVEPASVRVFGAGTLLAVASFDAGPGASWTDALTDDRVRYLAIANPRTAPYGVAAVEALTSQGLWDALEPSVVYGESVAQTLQFVRTGNADVGLVAASLVRDGLVDGLAVYAVDARAYEPIAETLGVVSESGQRELAQRFVDALAGA